jgi:hypothetical protein
MPNILVFFVVIVVIDLILKSVKDKKKVERERNRNTTVSTNETSTRRPQVEQKRSGTTLRDLRRIMEEEFQKQTGNVENSDTRTRSREDDTSRRGDDTPKKREITAKQARQELIKSQKEKINKHSEFEKSKRLQKEQMLTKARLSDSQVTLASQHPNHRKMDHVVLETRRPVTIEVKDTSESQDGSRPHGILNIQEDILKGIIYSEILSKPKSMQK